MENNMDKFKLAHRLLAESQVQRANTVLGLIEEYRLNKNSRVLANITTCIWHEAETALRVPGLTEGMRSFLHSLQQGRISESYKKLTPELAEKWHPVFKKSGLLGLAELVKNPIHP
jgi:hypothetical protein